MTKKTAFVADRVANPDLTGWLKNHAVLVEHGRIVDVVPLSRMSADPSDQFQIFELGDVSLLPGLVEAHCHMHCSATPDAPKLVLSESVDRLFMRATSAMRRALLSGTTTVRDIGSRDDVAFPILQAIEDKVIPGPRLICSGAPVTTTAGHCWFWGGEADTTEEVIVGIRSRVKQGAKVIKMMATGGMLTPTANPRMPQYSVETLKAAVQEAERLNVQIVAHTLSAEGVRRCAEAGIHHLIHARWLSANPNEGLKYDPDTASMIADKGLWVDATIGHHLLGIEARGKNGGRIAHWSVGDRPVTEEEHLETLIKMTEAGVRFTTGLDMGMSYADHGQSSASAWAYHEWLGWDQWRAIRSATVDTAEALRFGSELGRIERGYIADMAAYAGDPATNIRDLNDASSVIQNGSLVKLAGRSLI